MQYNVGDYLVHENSGVCQISDISDMEFAGKGSMRTYYVMTPIYKSSSQVFMPVDGTKVRLREVTAKEEFEKLLDNVDALEVIIEPNDRQRVEVFKNVMADFTPNSIARVVKTVLIRKWIRIAAGKKVMAQDEKMLSIAGKKLYEEMAFSLGIDISEAQARFEEQVSKHSDEAIAALL